MLGSALTAAGHNAVEIVPIVSERAKASGVLLRLDAFKDSGLASIYLTPVKLSTLTKGWSYLQERHNKISFTDGRQTTYFRQQKPCKTSSKQYLSFLAIAKSVFDAH